MTIAALIATVLLALVAVFQVALALGAPLGDMAWGGRNTGVLPIGLRLASGITGLLVYPLITLAILASAGLIEAAWLPLTGPIAMWSLAVLLGLGAVANLASRSPRERLWGPVAGGIAVCCAVVAIGL
jgi:hypothetical protein